MGTTQQLLLGDLVQAVGAVAAINHEMLASRSHLINKRVQLGGDSTRAGFDLSSRTRKVTGLVV